jgi:hypothetical protein
MRNRWFALFTAAAVGLTAPGCAAKAAKPDVRAVASSARVAVQVEQNTVTAPNLHKEVAGKLRETMVATKSGVPVTDRSKADLLIQVTIVKTNFTHAVEWQWNIVDAQTGEVLRTKTQKHAWGADGPTIANQIVGELATLDVEGGASETAIAAAESTDQGAGTGWDMPASTTDGSNAWAVVIGIEKYREKIPEATGATADADAFATFARETLNVPEANVKVLEGDRASRADLSAALFEWLPRNAVKDGGRVYVFFSGHGAPDVETGDSYLLPYDANPTYVKSGGLKVSDLTSKLSDLKGQQVYVFLDACFSGTGERSVLAEGTRPVVAVKKLPTAEGVVTFSAAGPDETTGADASGKHGLFTHYLIEGLVGGADADGDGAVSIAELHQHVTQTVPADARRQNRDQTPTVSVPDTVDPNSTVVEGIRK